MRAPPSHHAPQIGALFKRAAILYAVAQRLGGKALEALDSSLACELYLEACAIFEEENKEAFAMDTYRAAAAAMVRTERYGEAVTVLLRHAGACDRTGAGASLARCYLSAVVTYLAMGDVVGAEAGYYDFMEVRTALGPPLLLMGADASSCAAFDPARRCPSSRRARRRARRGSCWTRTSRVTWLR